MIEVVSCDTSWFCDKSWSCDRNDCVGKKLYLLVYFCFHIALLNLFGVSDPTDMMSGVNISIFQYI